MSARFAVCLVTIIMSAGAGAQPWSELRSRNPSGQEFRLRLVSPHAYHRGELIQAESRFPGKALTPGQPPPKEQWQFGGLLLDPPSTCGTVAKPCFITAGVFYPDKSDPMLNAGWRAEPFIFPLNSYLPVLSPGHYRVAVLARKLVMTARVPNTYGYADPAEYFVSDTVEFEVTAASRSWVQQTIAKSVALLKGPPASGMEGYQVRRAAAQQLRFLDDPASWRASLDLFPTEEGILLQGLAGSTQPAKVCELMQSRVPQPEQSVSSSYLNTLTQTCSRAKSPTPAWPPTSPEWAAYSAKVRTYQTELSAKVTADLAASLSQKQEEPKATAFATLIQYVQQLRYNRPPDPAPSWIPALNREFLRSFATVEPARKQYLLDLYASTMDSPELLPLLESVLDSWKPGDYYEAPRTALYAIHRVDPARARARIIAELTRPQTWLDTPALELLPPGSVAPMDDALIKALAEAQRPGGWNPQLRMAAIAKYGSARALPRIKAIFESQQDPCQPELVAYFVRVDPAYADKVFHRTPWDMLTPPPPCAVQYFERTPPLAFGPPLEKYMAAYLMHGMVNVKTSAARSLGRYGTETARAALWDAFRYFHNYWNGKGPELAGNSEGINLEVELRNAIARGRNWLTTETDLRTIQSLCISDRCLDETRQDLRAWGKQIRLEIMPQSGGIRGAVAQYYGLESVDAMKAKLAQFPRGSQFLLQSYGPPSPAAAEIRSFAISRGLVISDGL